MPITDEELMQFADHTLGAEDMRRIADAVARDPALQERLALFTQTGRMLAEPFGEIVNAPVPSRLVEAIIAGGRQAPQAVATARPDPVAGVKSLLDGLFSFGRPRFVPAFATVLLAVGATAGWTLHRATQAQDLGDLPLVVENGRIQARAVLASALETATTGQVTGVATSPDAVQMLLTFKSGAGQYCRQYQIGPRASTSSVGVACRNSAGGWQVLYHAPAQAIAPSGKQMQPTVDGKALLGKLIDAMGGSDPLTPEEEAPLVQSHWR